MPFLRLVWMVSALCAVAHAQEEPNLTTASKAHYDAGRAYFAQGETKRAIEEFRAGQRDDDRPAFDYNLGVSYEKLGDAARAVAAFRRFAARSPDQAREAGIDARVTTLEARVGNVVITSRTSSVSVAIDGEPVSLGDDRMLRVTAGTRRITGSREGYTPRTSEVVVTGGGVVTVDLTLEAANARSNRKVRNLAIGLGVAGGIVVVGLAVGLGVGLTRGSSQGTIEGNVPAITVRP